MVNKSEIMHDVGKAKRLDEIHYGGILNTHEELNRKETFK